MAGINLSTATVIRAIGANGTPGSGALLKVYEQGTATAVTTYSDPQMLVANAWPVIADSSGAFGPVYVAAGTYKIDVQTSLGVSLPGYPVDDISVGDISELSVTATGATTAQTIANRAAERLSVLDFGAVGDGSTDDTAAINAALATGADIVIPARTYIVNAITGLSMQSNQKLLLAKGAILQAAANNSAGVYGVIRVFGVSDVTVEGGTIIGDRATHTGATGESGMGVYVANSTNVTLRDITAKDCWGDGIYIGGTDVSGTSRNVVVDNCIATNNRRNNLTVAACDGCRIIGGKFNDANGIAPEYGIDLEPNPGKPDLKNVVVMGVTCEGNAQAGIGVSTTIASNVRLIDNTCRSNGTHGIVSGYTGSNLTIRGKTCNSNGKNGIFVFGSATYTTNDITVEGNTCKSNTEDGIRFEERCARFKVRGNTVELNGLHGMRFDGLTGWVEDGIIEENVCHSNGQTTHDTYDNIRVNVQCRFLRIADNICRKGSGANQPKYGVNVQSTSAQQIVDNDLYTGGNTANFNGLSANHAVQRNLGFKTEARVLSSGMDVRTAATHIINIPHGLAYTPDNHHCQLELLNPSGFAFTITKYDFFRSVDATNVGVKVVVDTGTGSGATEAENIYLALAVERPSIL